MTREDRVFLARLAAVNQSLGEVVTRVLGGLVDGQLTADHLRIVGKELESLGADMVARADVLDSVIDNDSGVAQQPNATLEGSRFVEPRR